MSTLASRGSFAWRPCKPRPDLLEMRPARPWRPTRARITWLASCSLNSHILCKEKKIDWFLYRLHEYLFSNDRHLLMLLSLNARKGAERGPLLMAPEKGSIHWMSFNRMINFLSNCIHSFFSPWFWRKFLTLSCHSHVEQTWRKHCHSTFNGH